MKAIIVGPHGINSMRFIADSAVGRDSMPLFLPDGKWLGMVCLAYRIERLGKCIAPKFAMRYADAVGVVLVLHPDMIEGWPPQWLGIMDGALTTGQWMPLPPGDDPIEIECNGDRWTIEHPAKAAAQAIAAVSSIATIKTGDIIVPYTVPYLRLNLTPNTRITASLNSTPALNLKVK